MEETGTDFQNAAAKLLAYVVTKDKKVGGTPFLFSLPVESLVAPQDVWRARMSDRDHVESLKKSLLQNPLAANTLEPMCAVLESTTVTPQV